VHFDAVSARDALCGRLGFFPRDLHQLKGQDPNMNLSNKDLAAIEAAWEPDDGAMWKLRQGNVDAQQIDALLTALEAIEISEHDALPRRFVSLIWYLPIFFEWQRERVAENAGDMHAFHVLSNRVVAVVQRLLGVP